MTSVLKAINFPNLAFPTNVLPSAAGLAVVLVTMIAAVACSGSELATPADAGLTADSGLTEERATPTARPSPQPASSGDDQTRTRTELFTPVPVKDALSSLKATPTPTPAGPEEPTPEPEPTKGPVSGLNGDYDFDDDGLIEISNPAQLNAIRYDMDGDGVVDEPVNMAKYREAFPDAADHMGCLGGGCQGYELIADLDLDTNNNGNPDGDDVYWNSGMGAAGLLFGFQ